MQIHDELIDFAGNDYLFLKDIDGWYFLQNLIEFLPQIAYNNNRHNERRFVKCQHQKLKTTKVRN